MYGPPVKPSAASVVLRLSWTLSYLLVACLVACGGDAGARLPPEPAADAAVWAKVQQVAAPHEPGTAGPADAPFVDALRTPLGDLTKWQSVFQAAAEAGGGRSRSLDDVPAAAAVVARLRAWADRDGALPYRCDTRIEDQPIEIALMIGEVGIYAASPIEHGPLQAAVVLARRMVLGGCTMADAMLGFRLLELARPRAAAIGARVPWPTIEDADIVRIIAAEALARRAMATAAGDPAQRQALAEALAFEVKVLGGDPSVTVAQRLRTFAVLRDEQARIWRDLDATSSRAAVLAAYQSIDDKTAGQLFAMLDTYRAGR